MKRSKNEVPWNYEPKHKIGTKVITSITKEIGIIKRIDNLYNWEYHKRAMPEYYIKWKNAWTRHECEYLDGGYESVGWAEYGDGYCRDFLIPLTPTGKLLYDPKD